MLKTKFLNDIAFSFIDITFREKKELVAAFFAIRIKQKNKFKNSANNPMITPCKDEKISDRNIVSAPLYSI